MATVYAHGNHRGDEDEDQNKSFSPFFYARPSVEKPCTACSSLCCGLMLFMVVLVAMLAGGFEVIRFSTDVPFYLYEHVSWKRQTALESAFDVANARLNGAPRELEQAEDDFKLKVIYELDDASALFSPEVLEGIQRMEEKIVAVSDYTNFCELNYDFNAGDPICVRHDSVVNFFDPDWWVPVTDPPPEPTVPSVFNAELVNQSKLAASEEENYYPFANPQDESYAGSLDLTQTNIDIMAEYWARYCSDATECPEAANGDESPYALTVDGINVTITNQITELVDTDFGIQDSGEVVSAPKAVMSVFHFGSPQREDSGELFDIDTDGMVEQTAELGAFLLDQVERILKDGVEGVNVFWDGEDNGMLDEYTNAILLRDGMLLLFSILFIVVYLIVSLKSWWLGGVGMLMILGNFGPALLIYRLVSGYSYFGTLNALSVFLVLGVGADDIFVFANTWKHIRFTEPDLPVLQQLQHSLYRGGKAMFVTSVTTALSFLMNAISDFPAVQSFGIFSAVLILCNFCTVISIYPAATMVYEYYFFDPNAKKSCCLATCGCCKKEKGYSVREGPQDGTGKAGFLSHFFQQRFYPFIHQFRIPVVVILAGIVAFYIALGSRLEPESESVNLLPDDDQYMKVRTKIDDYFSHSDTRGKLTVQIPFGVVGADRGDCSGSKCDPTIDTDFGAPIWGDIDGISDEYTQKWFLDFCDAIDTAEDAFDIRKVYEADDVVPVPVKCPFESFQTWCQQQDGICVQTHSILGTDEYIIDADIFHETFLTFLSDEVPVTSDTVLSNRLTNLDIWENAVRFEQTDDTASEDPKLRYITVKVVLSAELGMDSAEGIDLYGDWVSFLEKWVELAGTGDYEGADDTVGNAFVTDGGGFHFFYLQRKITREAFMGIGLSLLGAFIIVCLATSNWIVSALAILIITALVGGVVMFTVANGWKLGILEAVLFVMVVGFSVDYTLHLSDSYLESNKKTRGERTRDMLTTMGPSVLSGAISTIGATFPLLFAYFIFFLKFGTVVFFIIAQSLVFSLVLFSTLLDIVGPEEPEWGAKIKQGSQVLVREGSSNGGEDGKGGHLRLGKVAAVDTDAQTCTVQFVDEVSNGNGHGASEATVGVKSVRHRYQDGHIALVDKGFEALGRCVTKFCVRVSCFFDDANTEKTNLVRGEV